MPDGSLLVAPMAAAATAGLEGDPLWVLTVGGSSSGKTEVLKALGHRLVDEYMSEFTVPGLLSVTKGTNALPTGLLARHMDNGRLPRIVRADNHRADFDYSGKTNPDLGDGIDRDLAGDLMLSVLLGPICEGDASWPPLWDDLDRAPFKTATGDALALVRLVEYPDMDEDGYDGMVGVALHVADASFKAIHALIADGLERAPFITGPQLRHLLGPEVVATFLAEEVAA